MNSISKQTFLTALTCPAQGWYLQRAERGEITPGLQWQFHNGNAVGKAARQQIGTGILLPMAPLELAVDTTARRIAEPENSLLFEATFRMGSLVARADAIRRLATGWEVIEVKSSKEDAKGKVDPDLVDDLAYTVMVARAAGLTIERCTLMQMSRSYRLGSAEKVMVEIDVTAQVLARASEFADIAPEVVEILLGDIRPDPELTITCRSCDVFVTQCLGAGVATSIFAIPALSAKRLELYKPIVDLHKLPIDADLTDNQRRVFEVIRSGIPRKLDGLAQLDQVTWPVYYLDFETIMPALPWFDGDGAHTQHPFQFSVHRADWLDSDAKHLEYLAPTTKDWRRELAERLLEALGESGTIMMYTDFELKVLRALAELFPDLAPRLELAIARLFDLHEVVKQGYVHPGFGGRTSIKKVLPVLAPDLEGYAALDIAEGQSASGVFGLMRVGEYLPDTFDDWRQKLLAYCKLDTHAMIRVHRALEEIRKG